MGKCFPAILFLFLIFTVDAFAQQAASAASICKMDDSQKQKVEKCQKEILSAVCEDVPKENLRSCFDPSESDEAANAGKFTCAKGTWEGIQDSVKGVAEIASRAYDSVTDNKNYKKRVRTETYEACEKDKDVKKSREEYQQIVKNIGLDMAAMKYHAKLDEIYSQCISREQRKGQNLGISFELPKSDDLKSLFVCMNTHTQIEMACKVAGPMVVGGVAGAAIKTAVKSALRKTGLSAAGKVEKSYKDYLNGVKGQLSAKELESLKHQKDLLEAINNPEVAARIQAAGIDLDALTKGILDSDYGKLASGQKLLMDSSVESDHLLNILKGKDQTASGRAYRKHLDEIGQAGKADLPQYSNFEIRKIMKERQILVGQLHELPGMSRAFHDFEAGRITERQLIDRLNANRAHNHSAESSKTSIGQSGNEVVPFWDDLEGKVIPAQLKGDPLREKFFEGTIYDSGKVSEHGVVVPRSPPPTQKSVFVHSVFDRLSQGTGGGNVKIFYESAGKTLSDNPNISIGELFDFTNQGKKNGLNNLANQLTGAVIKLEDGKVVQTFSNAERTNVQFRGLQQAIAKSKYSDSEKSALNELARAARDRNLAYDEFAKNHIDYVKDANGNALKMSFKDANGNYIGTISKDTPTNEAMQLLAKFNKVEERLNGDPFKNLFSPRILSRAEIATYGLPMSGAYYHCQKLKTESKAVDTGSQMLRELGIQ